MVTLVSKTLCDKLKAGAIVIITTKQLQYPDEGVFRRVFDLPLKRAMSWGHASVNLYVKL